MGKGAFKQEMRVNFDTGSDWLVVETTECRTCLENRYDPDISSSFNEYWFGTNTELQYGSLHIKGYEALETVCFTSGSSHCIDKFHWFAITY